MDEKAPPSKVASDGNPAHNRGKEISLSNEDDADEALVARGIEASKKDDGFFVDGYPRADPMEEHHIKFQP